jgi:DNA-binding transcriptional regulator PaaX
MSKSNAVRRLLSHNETRFTRDVAREVGCTQPLVFQVIRAMKDEGKLFEERQIGRQVSYRLLTDAEANERRAARCQLEAERQRAREMMRLREQLAAARSTLDDALQRLDTLASDTDRVDKGARHG